MQFIGQSTLGEGWTFRNTNKLKAASRLELLRQAGLEVDTWLASTMKQAREELERERKLSEARVSNGGLTPEFDELDFTDFEEFDDNSEIFDEPSGSMLVSAPRVYPQLCKVLYSYQTWQSDELTITLDEQLEVIEDGDMEDWVKARNNSGQIGYVPEKYLQFLGGTSLTSRIPAVTSGDVLSYSSSSGSAEHELMGSGPEQAEAGECLARALYDYEGQSAEELNFPEGAIIKVLHTGEHGVDDGFWEGELNGRVGVFPSLVVELLSAEREELDSEMDPTSLSPPPFSPPEPDCDSLAFHRVGFAQQASPSNCVSGDQKEESQSLEPVLETQAGRLRPIRAAPPPPSPNPLSQQDTDEFLV
ncbi:F-BAR and double SH3 domains protein 2-like [Heptranchias perlo]|uniref:F-BAR and double SH3 domains protein 2-like n=1 Tax=Heptranchias perlo TaxID=212740 RepID=UPI00355A7845